MESEGSDTEARLVPVFVSFSRDLVFPRATGPLSDLPDDQLLDSYFDYLDDHWIAPLKRLAGSNEGSLIVLTVCYSLMEVYEQLRSGSSSKGSVAAFIRKGARRVLDGQMSRTMRPEEREAFAQRFTEVTRNALVHDLALRDMSIEFDGEGVGGFSMADDIKSGDTGVDPHWLLQIIADEFDAYRNALNQDPELRAHFRAVVLRAVEDRSYRD
ncbi:MAG: hypothetical protein WEA29_06115 [Acidimicrobiia bacterium]